MQVNEFVPMSPQVWPLPLHLADNPDTGGDHPVPKPKKKTVKKKAPPAKKAPAKKKKK